MATNREHSICSAFAVVLVALLSAMIPTRDLRAQDPACGGVTEPIVPPPGMEAGERGGGSTNCFTLDNGNFDLSPYRHQDHYIPHPDNHPELVVTPSGMLRPVASKRVRLSVHIWSNGVQGDQYAETQSEIAAIEQIIEAINQQHFLTTLPPTDPALDPVLYDYILDSRISLQLTGIYWHENVDMWDSDCLTSGPWLDFNAVNAVPESRKDIKLHIVKEGCCPGAGSGVFPIFMGSGFAVNAPRTVTCKQTDIATIAEASAFWTHHWAHELGHIFGLHHMYNGPEVNASGIDFLEDVFSCHQQYLWCPLFNDCDSPVPTYCWFNGWGGCDPWQSQQDDCSNNLMGNNGWDHRFTSPMQMGRMHRALVATNVSRYGWGYSNIPYTMLEDETWEWPLKFYQDIRVQKGRTLTIKCEVQMVPEARIIVEPGARLIIDGGVVRAAEFSWAMWRGVEVWGDVNASQVNSQTLPGLLEHQGLIEIKNGGEIRQAEIGVLIGSRDVPFARAGGVIRMEGWMADPMPNVIRNCQTSVKFEPYVHYPNGTGYYVSNRSSFRFARFEIDDNYENQPIFNPAPVGPFRAHIDMNKVVGIPFRACTFLYYTPWAPPATSTLMGKGIKAFNSTFFVTSSCAEPGPCPSTAWQAQSNFYGVGYGVHSTGPAGRFSVTNSTFSGGVCGIYANGQNKLQISNNSFVVGADATLDDPMETPWQGFHRGVFLTECKHLSIRDNVLQGAAIQPGTEGIVVGFTRESNEVVFNNVGYSLTRGFVGEGVCASILSPVDAFLKGLQFICNQNYGNFVNVRSRTPQGTSQLDLPFCTIRELQGLIVGNLNVAADNYFDQCPGGLPGELDYDVQTAHLIYYIHRIQSQYEPVCTAGPMLGIALPIPSYPGCVLIPFTGEPPQFRPQWEAYSLAEKTAYGELRFLYDGLIDGGSTDEVVQEIIDAWPQDFWDLRAYLLSKSPFLSVDALKEAMDKPGFPDAMRTEICIANPEATKKEGFMEWLRTECFDPLPEHLYNSILASWDERTYRFELEAAMAGHHANHSQAVIHLLNLHEESEGFDIDQYRADLQILRTVDARYTEAFALVEQHRYVEAAAVITALPSEHDLGERELDERGRMIAWIDFLEELHDEDRSEAQLDAAEVQALAAGIDGFYDRVTNAISNSLCYHYDICRPTVTGGDEEPKARLIIPEPPAADRSIVVFQLLPNPASTWVALDYDLNILPAECEAVVRDLVGRIVIRKAISEARGQLLIDTRELSTGTYLVEVLSQDGALAPAQKLQIQQ